MKTYFSQSAANSYSLESEAGWLGQLKKTTPPQATSTTYLTNLHSPSSFSHRFKFLSSALHYASSALIKLTRVTFSLISSSFSEEYWQNSNLTKFSIVQASPDQSLKSIHKFTPPSHVCFQSSPLLYTRPELLKEQTNPVQLLIKQLMQFAPTRQLVEEVNRVVIGEKVGRWSIKLQESDDPHFLATCNFEKRMILLNFKLDSAKALGYLVFELLNAKRYSDFHKLHLDVFYGKCTKESYTKQCEAYEYKSALEQREIITQAIEQMGWPKESDVYKDLAPTFEAYWQEAESSHHADHFRCEFDKLRSSLLSVILPFLRAITKAD